MIFKLLIIYSISVLAFGETTTDISTTETQTTELSTTETAETETTIEESTTTETITEETETTTEDTTTTEITTEETTETESTTEETTETETTTEETTTTETTTEETTTTPAPPTFADYINISTKNLLGINCLVQNIYNLQSVSENFQYDISLCSAKIKQQTSAILDKVKELESYATKIEQANDKICKNANFKEKSDAANKPSAKCVKNITNNMNKLNENLEITYNKVSKYFDKTTNGCASMSLLKLKLTLGNFLGLIEECAKLADNV